MRPCLPLQSYNNFFYVTVSLNATGFGPGATASQTQGGKGVSTGQFLHTSPSTFNRALPSGQMTLWSSYLVGQLGHPNYFSTDLLTSSLSSWSCFTYAVNLANVCDPSTSVHRRDYGCVLRGTNMVGVSADLSNKQSLFFTVRFNLTRYSMNTAENNYCGSYAPATASYTYDQVMAMIPVTTIDLYNNGAQSLPVGCSYSYSSLSAPPPPTGYVSIYINNPSITCAVQGDCILTAVGSTITISGLTPTGTPLCSSVQGGVIVQVNLVAANAFYTTVRRGYAQQPMKFGVLLFCVHETCC